MFTGFVNLHRCAVEVRIGEMVGGPAEVDDREIVLLGVFMHAGATADDLFKLGHGADFAIKDDESAGLGIDSGGEQS